MSTLCIRFNAALFAQEWRREKKLSQSNLEDVDNAKSDAQLTMSLRCRRVCRKFQCPPVEIVSSERRNLLEWFSSTSSYLFFFRRRSKSNRKNHQSKQSQLQYFPVLTINPNMTFPSAYHSHFIRKLAHRVNLRVINEFFPALNRKIVSDVDKEECCDEHRFQLNYFACEKRLEGGGINPEFHYSVFVSWLQMFNKG